MRTLLLVLIFISNTYAYIDQNTLATLRTSNHWNTFRIVISDTKDECFYLETKLNDTIHVIYQVLKGSDGYIRVTITDPLGNAVYTRAHSPFGWYNEKDSIVPGTYQICFKNERYFATKILYIGVLAMHIDILMEATVNEIKEKRNNKTVVIEEFSASSMKSLQRISNNLILLTAYQTVVHVHHTRDLYTVTANASYVQKWAIYQILTMILCSIIQVFCIRRLFKTPISKKISSNKNSNQNFHSQTSDYFIIAN